MKQQQQQQLYPVISVRKNVQCTLCHEFGHSETTCGFKRNLNNNSQSDSNSTSFPKAKIKKSNSLMHKTKETPLRIAPIIISSSTDTSSNIESVSNFEKTLMEIEEGLDVLSTSANTNNELTKDYCLKLRKNVNQTSREAFQKLSNIKESFLAKIDNYEREILKSNTKFLNEDNFQKNLENQLIQLTKYLNRPQINEQTILIANNAANNLKKRVDDQKLKLGNAISMRSILKFEKSEKIITASILGKFTQEYVSKLSCILSNDQMRDLLNLCEFPIDQKWSLIYRASNDGFETSKFHSQCNQRPNTLIIMKSVNGHIFGGYTEADWSGTGYRSDPNAFIFSYINSEKVSLKMKCKKPNNAIYCFQRCIAFGEKDSDLFVCSNANKIIGSHSNLGHSYSLPESVADTNTKQAKCLLAGTFNFLLSEIEVYTKEF